MGEAGPEGFDRALVAVALVGAVLFLLLAADVANDGALATWDRTFMARVYADDPAGREALYDDVLSRPGDVPVLAVLLVVGTAAVAYWGHSRRAALMLSSGMLGIGFVHVVKALVGRDRPNVSLADGPDAFVAMASERSAAFPSGHVFDTMVVYGLLLWFGLGAWMARRPVSPSVPVVLVAAWLALTAAMGVFRVLGGVHWPADVLASWALGATWLVLTLLVDRRLEPAPAADGDAPPRPA